MNIYATKGDILKAYQSLDSLCLGEQLHTVEVMSEDYSFLIEALIGEEWEEQADEEDKWALD